MKAKFRPEILKEIMDQMMRTEGVEVQQSCLNCWKFTEQTEFCNQYQARPPARVIAFGCPTWEDERKIPY